MCVYFQDSDNYLHVKKNLYPLFLLPKTLDDLKETVHFHIVCHNGGTALVLNEGQVLEITLNIHDG